MLPVWETWYSASEVFVDGPNAATDHDFHHPFQVPRQSKHLSKAFGKKSTAVLSFVKYDRPAAQFIWDQNYYLRRTLQDLGRRFDKESAPVAQRTIEPLPHRAVALKVVFWLVKKGKLTALPVWDPHYPPPPRGQTPTHLTWRKCVAVDPSGRYAEGTMKTVVCNGRRVSAPVVHLDRFYHYRLSDRTDVLDAREFLLEFSQPKEEEQFVANPSQRRPQIGDYAALMAMHVSRRSDGRDEVELPELPCEGGHAGIRERAGALGQLRPGLQRGLPLPDERLLQGTRPHRLPLVGRLPLPRADAEEEVDRAVALPPSGLILVDFPCKWRRGAWHLPGTGKTERGVVAGRAKTGA